MRAASLLSILHISDFHYTARKRRDQSIIVDALIDDLKRLCIGHQKPDLILFTGDLVQAAGKDCHSEVYDVLIDRVSKVSGCSEERIFLVPGNHDLSWNSVDAHSDFHRSARGVIGTGEEEHYFNELYDNEAHKSVVRDKFSDFYGLEEFFSGNLQPEMRAFRNSFATVDKIDSLNVDVVVLNSAVFSTGGRAGFERDEQLLVLPEYVFRDVEQALTPGSIRVFAAHHPFKMFSERNAKVVESEISRLADMYFFGHMHDPQPKGIAGLRGDVLLQQAGAIFTQRKGAYNGYSLTLFEPETSFAKTCIRSYFPERNIFGPGEDVTSEGLWYSSQSAREYYRNIAAPVDKKELSAYLCGEALKNLRAREGDAGGYAEAHEKFVPPPLVRHSFEESTDEERDVQVETPAPFSDLVLNDENIIIYARPEYGRTTLLKEWRLSSLINAAEIKFPRVPVLLDFASISSNADNMLRICKGNAEQFPEEHSFEGLLSLGYVSILIDDVSFSDHKRMRILRSFVSRYPKARYILSSSKSSATQYGAVVDPEMPVRFGFVEIKELGRREMRKLLTKYESCTDVEAWLNRLQDEFKEINLPFTAANGSILIEILAEKYNFSPINRSVLVEQFVDSTLRKAAVEQSRRETFDYTNKTDLLAEIAAWMAILDQYTPTREDLRSQIKKYVDDKGLTVSIDALMDEFFGSRIFVTKSEQRVSFRYRSTLEYFIALRMVKDPDFRDWVMDSERYLQFVNEIQYYAGKLRTDVDLVTLVAERHELLRGQVEGAFENFDPQVFDTLELPGDEDGMEISELVSQLGEKPLSEVERDQELEGYIPSDAEDRQEVFRPKLSDLGEEFLVSLILYSGLIKNMELISDTRKRAHLDRIWRGWALLLYTSIYVSPQLAKQRRMRINGVMYEVIASYGMSDKTLLRRMMLLLPHVHIKMLSGALGTEKLEKQLTEPTLDEAGEPKIYSLLRAGLVADLGLQATPGVIDQTADLLQQEHYLLRSLVVHVSQLRRLGMIEDNHFSRLEGSLAKSMAKIQGGTKSERMKIENKQRRKLRQESLLLKMKRINEDKNERRE